MASNVWPVDAVGGAPSYSGRVLRQTTVSVFASMGTKARRLGAKSGVRPPSMSGISVTSTTWSVDVFGGIIDGESSGIAGAYAYSFDTAQTGSIAAAGAAARIDRLDVQVSDPAESDGSSAPSIAVVYTQGAATGGLPPAAPARSHALCQINVPATGGGSPTVTYTPDYCAAAGAPWVFQTTVLRDAYVTAIGAGNMPFAQQATVIQDPVVGQAFYTWDGSTWIPSSDTANVSTFGTGFSSSGGNNVPRVRRQGNMVFLLGSVAVAAGASGSNILTVPAAFQPPNTNAQFIGGNVNSSGEAYELRIQSGTISIQSGYINGTVTAGETFPVVGFWWMD